MIARGEIAGLFGLAIFAACAESDPEGGRKRDPAVSLSAHAVEPDAHHEDGPFRFTDVTAESGLGAFRQVNGSAEKPFIVETVGAGVAFLDYDQDGALDVYLSNGGTLGAESEENPKDALFRGDGSGCFEDRSVALGIDQRHWTNGVRVVDIEGDGDPDLFLTNYGPNVLFRNDGDGFEDVSRSIGLQDPSWSTGASFFDFDRDGDLDLYVANYVDFDEPRMLRERPTSDYRGVQVMKGPRGLPAALGRLYRNEDGAFQDVSEAFGIHGGEAGFAFQTIAFDFDEDGWSDLYVANDSVANSLWINRAGEGFLDRAFLAGAALSMAGRPQAGMGVGLGDYDNDGRADLFVTNFAD